jgi:hypothetical protein
VHNPDGIRDLSHIHSSAYRGVFFLAVLSYIEIAVYFVLDQAETQGIAIPLIQMFSSVFLLQPMLQLSWVVCNLWLDKLAWNMTLKRKIRDVVLLVYSAISLAENFIPSDDIRLEDSAGENPTNLKLFLALLRVPFMFILFFCTHTSLTTTFILDTMLRGTKWRFPLYLVLLSASYLILRTIIVAISLSFSHVLAFNSISPDIWILVCAAVLMPLQLLVVSLEAWAEKKHLSKRMAFLVRSVFLLCLSPFCLLLSQLLSYTYVNLFLGGFLFSFHVWSVMGLCFGCRHLFDTALVRQALYWRNLRWMDIGVPLPYSAPAYPPPQT